MTSLADDEDRCESTLDGLTTALMTRRKYASDPLLKDDIERLISISSRWIEDCLNVSPGFRTANDVHSLLDAADLIFGHCRVFWPKSSFYRSRRRFCSCFLSLK